MLTAAHEFHWLPASKLLQKVQTVSIVGPVFHAMFKSTNEGSIFKRISVEHWNVSSW